MRNTNYIVKVVVRETGHARYVASDNYMTTVRAFARQFKTKAAAQAEAIKWKQRGRIVRTNKVYSSPAELRP